MAGASEVTVKRPEGNTYDAEVVGTNPSSDLAVVKIDAEDLSVIPYGEVQDVRVGNRMMAVGSPFSVQLGSSVTAGIVSANGCTGFNVGASGTDEDRPEYQKLLDSARKRTIDVVLVWRYDRFSRPTHALVNAHFCSFTTKRPTRRSPQGPPEGRAAAQ